MAPPNTLNVDTATSVVGTFNAGTLRARIIETTKDDLGMNSAAKLSLTAKSNTVDAVTITSTDVQSGMTLDTGSLGLTLQTNTTTVTSAAAKTAGSITIKTGAGLNGADAGASGDAGAISLTTGSGTFGKSGALSLTTGNTSNGGNVGGLSLVAGNAANGGSGGSISLTAGSSSTSTSGGAITLESKLNGDKSIWLKTNVGTSEQIKLESVLGTGVDYANSKSAVVVSADAGGVLINAGSSNVNALAITSTGGICEKAGTDYNLTAVNALNVTSTTGDVAIGATVGYTKVSGQKGIYLNSNTTITGNLVVNGTTTTLNTANLSVDDNIITCNLLSQNAAQPSNPDGGLVMYRYPQDVINATTTPIVTNGAATACVAWDPSKPDVFESVAWDVTSFADAANATTPNYFKGYILRKAGGSSQWSIIVSSTAVGNIVTMNLGGHSSDWVSVTTASSNPGFSFQLYQPIVYGSVWKQTAAISALSADSVNTAGSMFLATAKQDPGSVFNITDYVNLSCKAAAIDASTDMSTVPTTPGYVSVNMLYMGKPMAGQWRFSLYYDNEHQLRLERYNGTAWEIKGIWA